MKVVLDANVLVSFLLTSGQTITEILVAWKKKKFTLLVSEEILTEIKQVLARFVLAGLIEDRAADALVRRIETEAQTISVVSTITASPDRKDNRYLACAKDGGADYLVTGDKKHLLPLKKFENTKIVSLKEFVGVLKKLT